MPVPLAGIAMAAGRAAGAGAARSMGAGATGQKVGSSVGASMGRRAAMSMGMDTDSRKTPVEMTQNAAPAFNIRSVAGY